MRWRVALFCLFMLVSSHGLDAKKHKSHAGPVRKDPCSELLKGRPESLERQNRRIDAVEIHRFENDADLAQAIQDGSMVLLEDMPGMKVNEDQVLPKFRYVRPWVRDYLFVRAAEFYKLFGGRSFQINSAVRTREYQRKLRQINPKTHKPENANAAEIAGPRASSHIAGTTVDVAKKGLTRAELQWFRMDLCRDERENLIEATEERKQAVLHFMVFPQPSS